ncbi:MAG TPA: DUF378 domain-containing protein [Candidatus Thermoplasmatota archaeon]|nr:DUF378 domain-containing protein [Candidatus Thermoplasmatota archaeon]
MAERHMNPVDLIALVLVIVGALNWGLVGLFDFNLVAALFGVDSLISRTLYVLIGLAGLYAIWTAVKAGQDIRHVRPGAKHV